MLPVDADTGTLVGRLPLDDGPTVVLIRDGLVEDVSHPAPTVADLLDHDDPASVEGCRLFEVGELASLRVDRFLAPGPVVLVNNAANDDRHRVDDVTEEYWENRLNVNLKHVFFCSQAVIPGMKSKGGKID